MSKKIDLIGQVYGRLTVLEDVGRTKHKKVIWKCQCECGNTVDVRSGDLRSGATQSCGCLHKEQLSKRCYKDLTGQKFGRLTVLEDVGRKQGGVLWRCICECGNIVEVVANNLPNGDTQSCGCLQKELVSKRSYKDLTGQKFGRLTVLEDVGRTKDKKVLWKCLCDCGNTVNVMANNLQSGATQSCGCYKIERTSEIHRIDLVGQKFNRLTVLEDVGRTKQGRILWRCQCECGDIVSVSSRALQSGNTQSCGCYRQSQLSGEKNHNWKGGITPLYSTIRNCVPYKEWRFSVFKRDTFLCQVCNQPKRKLNAHHIKLFSDIMEEHNITTFEEAIGCDPLWDIDNGITLCKKCHKQTHREMRDAKKTRRT